MTLISVTHIKPLQILTSPLPALFPALSVSVPESVISIDVEISL